MNLFLVTSPFQYLCATEALHTYQTTNNILLLVSQDSEPGISQEQKLLDRTKWQHIIEIPRTSRSTYVPKAIKEIRKLSNNTPIEHFFHAEYMAWRTKLILRNLPINKEVYFDDGTLTINEYEESIRPRVDYHRPRLLQDLKIYFQGCKPIGKLQQSNNLELFSIFNIENTEHSVIPNNLDMLKADFSNIDLYDKSAPIGFIGQGAIGHKRRKTIEQYISELEFFIKEHDRDIIYFPHRTESQGLRSRVSKLKRVNYHYSSLPLELELLEKNIKLSGLVGILSTVQFTSKMLFPDMPVYNLDSGIEANNLSEKNKLRNERIHTCFSKLGIIDIKMK